MLGSESWSLTYIMMRALEGTHIGLLCQIMGKQARRQADWARETPAAEEVAVFNDNEYPRRRRPSTIKEIPIRG